MHHLSTTTVDARCLVILSQLLIVFTVCTGAANLSPFCFCRLLRGMAKRTWRWLRIGICQNRKPCWGYAWFPLVAILNHGNAVPGIPRKYAQGEVKAVQCSPFQHGRTIRDPCLFLAVKTGKCVRGKQRRSMSIDVPTLAVNRFPQESQPPCLHEGIEDKLRLENKLQNTKAVLVLAEVYCSSQKSIVLHVCLLVLSKV